VVYQSMGLKALRRAAQDAGLHRPSMG
jgi:hypothetical protein